MAASGLTSAFLSRLPPQTAFAHPHDLESALRARLDAGCSAWSDLEVDPSAFARYLAERTAGAALPAIERAADLYLACACVLGDPSAVKAFHVAYKGDIVRAAARIDPSAAFVDDVAQAVSERLFVRAGDAPARIAEYAGRASLRGWVGTVTKHVGLNMRRSKDDRSHDPLSSSTGGTAVALGPEMALLKARYKTEFETAIRAAMATLSAKDRTLLLLHLVDGVTLPQLATMQNVSRATVARRLSSAREALHDETQRELAGRLRLSPSELKSVTALVRSQLDVSFSSAMRDVKESP